MQNTPAVVAPYCGQTQQQYINVPAPIAYKGPKYSPEEGPWAMLSYASLYPQPPEPTAQFLPPPISKTALWDAQQTWPL
jgi:hypothetical protein